MHVMNDFKGIEGFQAIKINFFYLIYVIALSFFFSKWGHTFDFMSIYVKGVLSNIG